jgi:hypothetical protein
MAFAFCEEGEEARAFWQARFYDFNLYRSGKVRWKWKGRREKQDPPSKTEGGAPPSFVRWVLFVIPLAGRSTVGEVMQDFIRATGPPPACGSEAGIDGFGFEGEDAEDTFVDAAEGFLAHEAFEGFHAEGEFAHGEGAFAAETAGA